MPIFQYSKKFVNNIRLRTMSHSYRLLQRYSIVLPICAGFVLSSVILTYPLYSPLIFSGIVVAVIMLIASFHRPIWVLYAALFILFLPSGLIPPYIHSFMNRSITVVAFITWLLDVVNRRHRVIWKSTTLLMIGFIAWIIITIFWAENLQMGMTALGSYTLRLILFLILIPNLIRTKENLDGFMNTLALNGWILVIISFCMILLEGFTPNTRFTIFSENENELGILYLLTMIGVLWMSMQSPKRNKALKIIATTIFLMMIICFNALTGSRGSAFSLIFTLSVFLIWKPTRLWGKLSLLSLILAVIFVPNVFKLTLKRFVVPETTLLGGRETIWKIGWEIITKNPLSGVGIGNSAFETLPKLNVWNLQDGVGAPIHNPIMVIWSETGIPGIILYLGVLISAILSFLREYQNCRRIGAEWLMPYFSLIASVFLGYMISWIKGGGTESSFSYFLMVALLLIPSSLDVKGFENKKQIKNQ